MKTIETYDTLKWKFSDTIFIISVIGGTVIEKLGMEKYVADIVKRVWIYILLGVGIGSIIHNVIPEEIIQIALGGEHWYSVLPACLVGIPMYADIFGAIPIAEALFAKGAGCCRI